MEVKAGGGLTGGDSEMTELNKRIKELNVQIMSRKSITKEYNKKTDRNTPARSSKLTVTVTPNTPHR